MGQILHPQKEPTPLTPWLQASLQNFEMITFCYLNHSVRGTWLLQSQETNTALEWREALNVALRMNFAQTQLRILVGGNFCSGHIWASGDRAAFRLAHFKPPLIQQAQGHA